MCKSVLLAAVGALSMTAGALAQTARLDVQVSNDNVNWSDSLFAPAGSTVFVRVVATTTLSNAVGLGNITFQPTLSGWTSGDTRMIYSNAASGAASLNNTGLPANIGRMYPYGAASMAPSSVPGLLTSFNDSGTLRIAGSKATRLDLNLDYGVIASQNPKPSYPNYSQSTNCVIFKYGVQLGGDTTLRQMIADVPLAGIKNSRISWFTSLSNSSGNPVNITLTQADIDPAVVSVGPPNTPPMAHPDSYNMLEDESLVVTTSNVLGNDVDPDAGETLTTELVSTTANGNLTFNSDGTFAYVPRRDFNGAETFTYLVRDRYNVASNVATVTINVADVNDEPTFAASNPASVSEDAGVTEVANWASFNPGPGETQGVLEYEVLSVGNPNLFAMGGWPTVSANGTLRYTPAANNSGQATFELRVRDTGGTNNGGYDMSGTQVFTINVLPVNDAPQVTTIDVPSVLEDSAQRSIPGFATFNPGPGEADQVLLGYAVSNISNPSLFTLAPTVAPDGTLVYTPAPNAAGTSTFTLTARDSGGTANGGLDTSSPRVVSITIAQVNDAPSFSASAPATILEDASAQTISNWASFNSGGGAAEATQAVDGYIVSNVSNAALFAAGPSISNSGVLTYTPAPNASGSSTFTVRVRDNGGTSDGGVDTSAPQVFTINITAVNDAPSFIAATSLDGFEDAGARTLNNWATFNPGAGETGQAVSAYLITNLTNPSLFAAAPSISADGSLTYTTANNASGTSTFQVRVRDAGGTANGGVDTSPAQTITLSVAAVNDAPSVALGNAPTINEDALTQNVSGFASFSAGPGESQSLAGYVISNVSDPSFFAVQPSVSNTGVLSYRVAPNAHGTVTFHVQARDNGGTANGGVDLSEPATATITVNAINDAPSFVAANPAASNEDGGTQTLTNWAEFNAGPNEAAQSVLAYSITSLTNSSLFAVQPSISVDGTLTYTAAANASGSSTMQVRVRDNGGVTGGGVDTSPTQSFTITINSVNDAPSVSLGAIPTIVEDGGSQSVPSFAAFNAGPGESQSLIGYTVSNVSNPAMFAAGPNISNTGVLTYTPASNASGSVSFTVTARDSGGTANGGVDTSAPAQATLTITNVNDAPSFAASNPPASNEDGGTVVVTNWSNFNPGPFEGDQTAEYTVTNISNPSLFATPPSVNAFGSLSYVAANNASGTSTFTVRVRDDGGTASGGQDTSGTQTFTITVNAVNDAPEVTLATAPTIEEDAPAQVVPGFAAFSAGAGETGQSAVEYLISDISNPAAFAVAPAVSSAGVLTYTPATDASGTITFAVRVRDNGGTANGGQDVSQPAIATLTINGINDPPIASARSITIDARSGCVGLTVAAGQIDSGSYDPDNGPAELTYRLNRSGEFPVGATPVTLTVTDPDGLSSSANAVVTVLAVDSNNNTVPDTCDELRGGGGPDCDNDGDSDESLCIWENGLAAPGQTPPDGQLSQYGGNVASRVADDFYLQPGLLYRLTSFRGQVLTNSIERTARLSFFRDCDGRPEDEPFATFETSNVASESEGQNGKLLVTYVFEFCDDKFVLEGDATYWVSLQGKVNCNATDQAFWASAGAEADPFDMIASVPYKAFGVGDHPCTTNTYDAWISIAECCIGCANMAYTMTGSTCQLAWDNGPVDLGPTRGGDPSGINRGIFSRAADTFVVKPCRTETICWIEAYIWTNCLPVHGFLELYADNCGLPTGNYTRRIAPTDIIEIDETAVIDGVTYRLVKLEFWNIPWTLDGGRNYWLSVGADGAGSFNARSFFAYSDPNAPCGCTNRRIVYGANRVNRQADDRWLRSTREYAFRIATKPFFMDPIDLPGGRACPPDFNEDGVVAIGDLLEYLQAFFAGCP